MTYRFMLTILLVSAIGCSPSLEAARARAPESTLGAAPGERDEARCRGLSRTESALRYVGAGAAVLGGGSGLATIPTEYEAQTVLAVTAAGFAVGAVTVEAVRTQLAADYVEECQ